MFHWRWRYSLIGALTVLLVAITAMASLASTAGFAIISITPNPFDPSSGQSAAIRYSLPVTCNYQVTVQNSEGTVVRSFKKHTDAAADNKIKLDWDGTDNLAQIVPDGSYTVVIQGTTTKGAALPSVSGTVEVTGQSSSSSAAFSISGVSPNPFDPTQAATVLSYTVPTAADYSIVAENSAGTVVTSIVTYSNQPAGSYNQSWTGKDNAGNVLPNGAYTLVIAGTTTSGIELTTATVPVTIAVAAPPQAFAISSMTPNPYNPSAGNATINYTVPVKADVTISVSNSSGTVVYTLPKITGQAAGSRTATWNGENSSGAVVPNGSYTVTVSGVVSGTSTVITAATASLSVSTPAPSPPPTNNGELGQTMTGCGSANFAWMQYAASEKFGVMFIAPKSGTISSITEQWKEEGGYGGGNHGTFTFQLQSNGAGNYPSGTVLAQTTGITPASHIAGGGDGPLTFPITCTLTAGTIYHLVIFDTDPNYSTNWSSPNTLMSMVLPWDGTVGNRGECFDTVNGGGGAWKPWTSQSNIWGSASNNFLNGSHVPLMLTWSDGSNTGDPYYSAASAVGHISTARTAPASISTGPHPR